MQPDTYDLAVVGAGPGGTAAALTAARAGLAVIVFDPRPEADKPCGEGILPPGVRALRELELEEILGAGCPFDSIRYRTKGTPPLVVPLRGTGVSIPRPRLAAWLVEALSRERRVLFVRKRVSAERCGHGRFMLRAGDESFTARALAVADGARGGCAPWMRRDRAVHGVHTDQRVGIHMRSSSGDRLGMRLRARAIGPLDAVEVHLGSGSEVYLTPLPGGIVNVAVLFTRAPEGARGSTELLEHALSAHPAAAALLGEIVTRPACRRLGDPRRHVAGDAMFAVGDAGGGVDPILGCGVSIALSTGIQAGRAAAALRAGADPRYVERTYRRAYRRETDARRRLAFLLRSIASHPLIARAVVRLGCASPGLARAMVGIAIGTSAPEERAA